MNWRENCKFNYIFAEKTWAADPFFYHRVRPIMWGESGLGCDFCLPLKTKLKGLLLTNTVELFSRLYQTVDGMLPYKPARILTFSCCYWFWLCQREVLSFPYNNNSPVNSILQLSSLVHQRHLGRWLSELGKERVFELVTWPLQKTSPGVFVGEEWGIGPSGTFQSSPVDSW